MGFWRTIYYIAGWDYIGTKEQVDIERQRKLKYQLLKDIKDNYKANQDRYNLKYKKLMNGKYLKFNVD